MGGFPLEASGGGVQRGFAWRGRGGGGRRASEMGSPGVGRCAGTGKMEVMGAGMGVARRPGFSFTSAV